MNLRSIILKLLPYLLVGIIFYFLFHPLVAGWQKIKEYSFSFNYYYLALSFVFTFLATMTMALGWRRIIVFLDPSAASVSRSEIIKIFSYSIIGKYIPGQIWAPMGRVYLGNKSGLNKEVLIISVLYETLLAVIAGFSSALILLISLRREIISPVYLIFFAAIFIIFTLVNSRFFYRTINYFSEKFIGISISQAYSLKARNIGLILVYYFLTYIMMGVGFFILIESITFISFGNIFQIIGGFSLALVIGTIALFVPAGLGVREGILVLFLQLYFPLGIAVLIALVARFWDTLGEVFVFMVIWGYFQIKNKPLINP